MTRREFVRQEAEALGRFLGPDDDQTLVAWRRSYRCECGFRCTGAGELYDHAQTCGCGSGSECHEPVPVTGEEAKR